MSDVSRQLRIRLKELRLANGLTQEEYAERCGIPYKVLQHLERGRRDNPRLSTLEKLAEGVGVSVHDLFAPSMPSIKKKLAKPVLQQRRKGA